MKNIIQISLLLISFTLNACSAPIKNAKTETYKVWGNCNMCQKTIEAAALKKGEAKAEWNKDTKIASLTFDSTKTNANAILKRIAYSGYDNVKFLAPDDAYAKLAECCQYDRPKKETVKTQETTTTVSTEKTIYTCPMHPEVQSDKAGNCPKCGMTLMKKAVAVTKPIEKETPVLTLPSGVGGLPLADVYSAYFGLKDALTKDDGNTAAAKAKELLKAIEVVPMNKMKPEEHNIWMKVMSDLKFDATHISETKEVAHQRGHFATLSKNMHEAMKIIKPDFTVYFDHCPMYNDGKGAGWLSKESGIKNPFFGSQMIGCGSVKETIK